MTNGDPGRPASGPPFGRGPTGHDVARLAGVSQSTVSLVFRGASRGRVSEHTRQAVLAAARELGFRPNADARRLRQGAPPMVLIAVPDIAQPFFARVFAGARSAALEAGYQTVLSVQPDLEAVAADVTGQGVHAVLACSLRDGGHPPSDGVPFLVLDAEPPAGHRGVRFDLGPAMEEVVGHLYGLGHRRVAHLGADIGTSTFAERAGAVARACAERGMALTRRTVPIDHEAARAAAGPLLSGADAPTAVVCDDDLLAAGVYKAAYAAGLRVPADLSVTGVDDIAVARMLTPELSTVDLPGEGLGASGMRQLVTELEGRGRGAVPAVTRLPARFVVRESTAPPPARD